MKPVVDYGGRHKKYRVCESAGHQDIPAVAEIDFHQTTKWVCTSCLKAWTK